MLVLEKEDAGVLQGLPGQFSGLRVPCVYRRGGLNFVNRVSGDIEVGRSGKLVS